MGSDHRDNATGYPPAEPPLCANGCGFFGTAATNNMCSKCYRDLRVHAEQAASAKSAVEKFVDGFTVRQAVQKPVEPAVEPAGSAGTSEPAVREEEEMKVSSRCSSCRKKVGVLGFKCRCGFTFCGTHRYPEKHECGFDFKAVGKEAIAKANPVVKADKIDRI